ncbi:unnamed protein product [Rotaria sp. Silwood1]|nr:unnamed protein product [Rotaria sp. Silwood1]
MTTVLENKLVNASNGEKEWKDIKVKLATISIKDEKTYSSLNTLRDKANQLETCFNALREKVISKLNECSDCIKSVKNLYHQATEMTTVLENKLVNASNGEKEWKDIKVKLATTSIKGMIILN